MVPASGSPMEKILIVGLDGATWRVLGSRARAGRLPNLAALMDRGAWGPLRSTVPALTLPAWSSFMTGKNPGAHGIFSFRRLLPDRYESGGLASAADLRSATLWDIAGRAGKRVGAISVPPSYPIRPVNGFVVGCMLTPPGERFTDPPELAAELPDFQTDLKAPRGLKRDAPDYLARALPYLDGLVAQTRQRADACLRLMRRPWDLLCVVFYAPDRVQHCFWPAVEGEPEDGRVRDGVERVYEALDEALGRLVAAAPEATVILVSDHGFAPKPERAVHVNCWLAAQGLLRERSFWRARRRVMRKLVPRARRARYDTVDHMVDMAKSRAWAQTLEPGTAGIWVNVAGRYPLGCVGEGAEYEAVRSRIAEGLGALRDEHGRRVFRGIHRREELYHGPFVGEAPDLLAVCEEHSGVIYESVRRDLRAGAVFGPFDELGFTGAHHPEGIYLFAGPAIAAAGAHREYPIESIAPTSLHLLGLPVPRAMDGPVCTSLLRAEFLRARPVRFSDDDGVAPPPVAGWKSADDEALVADRLRALGYVE
jgi:predicted AlkP superfamily phosphohydrolase/phosphomutase